MNLLLTFWMRRKTNSAAVKASKGCGRSFQTENLLRQLFEHIQIDAGMCVLKFTGGLHNEQKRHREEIGAVTLRGTFNICFCSV